MEKKSDPQHLDLLAFARDAGHLQGEGVLADWPRLASEQYGAALAAGAVVWQLQGRTVSPSGGPDQIWLDLRASVQLPMQCQRCLTPVLSTLEAERSFRFVADEATAAALDDEAEEDILVISRDFDALSLVEDELILSLPLVPLHDVCPETVPMSAVDPEFEVAAERPNPFGVLASLKTGANK
ncbi:YceD family protein [Limnohabitans sp. DCL3]|uniref:YceD family protein n=1 Tax=Limnohabitans sp. DCL3 TaxID=3374103 RepID=UPI003A84EB23